MPNSLRIIKKIFNDDKEKPKEIYVKEDDNPHTVRKMFCLEKRKNQQAGREQRRKGK
jgi:hypothetical protein